MSEVVATTLHFLISLSENPTVAAVPCTVKLYTYINTITAVSVKVFTQYVRIVALVCRCCNELLY